MRDSSPLADLLPRSPSLVRVLDGAASDAQALVRDGLAVEVWSGVLWASDVPVGPVERAAAVGPLIPRGAVLARRVAVWIHTGLDRPSLVDVVLEDRHRKLVGLRIHSDRLDADDVCSRGRIRVTSLARTAVDVARWASEDEVGRWVPSLALAGLGEPALLDCLTRAAGLPHVARARRLLDSAGFAGINSARGRCG